MPWTNITSNISWQDLAVAEEIAEAYNKRADVAGLDTLETELGVEEITTAVTVFDFVHACQSGIEAMATSFASNTATLTGQSAYLAHFASTAAAMTAAGLTESGYWRRIAHNGSSPDPWTDYDDAGWSYGKITSKDLAGPWLWKDLQTALSALTRRVIAVAPSSVSADADSFYRGTLEYTSTPLPSIPDGDPQDYPATETSFVWFRMRFRLYNDTNTKVTFGFGDICPASRTVTNLKAYTKNISALILPVKNGDDFYDWGLGFTENETAEIDSAAATTATSFTYGITILQTFAALYADAGSGNLWEGFQSAAARIVVTYDFNP